jgi:hypothetical protein
LVQGTVVEKQRILNCESAHRTWVDIRGIRQSRTSRKNITVKEREYFCTSALRDGQRTPEYGYDKGSYQDFLVSTGTSFFAFFTF